MNDYPLSSSPFLTILRDKSSGLKQFREAAFQLTLQLAQEAYRQLSLQQIKIETPLSKMNGTALESNPILVPILRSGLAMLPPFQSLFPSAPVGMIGLKRDEKTKIADFYYYQIPPIPKEATLFLLDPMLATAGTAKNAVQRLIQSGTKEERIIFVGVVASEEGLREFKSTYPKIRTIIAALDPELNSDKFIVPGLGDFGDRYYGTVP